MLITTRAIPQNAYAFDAYSYRCKLSVEGDGSMDIDRSHFLLDNRSVLVISACVA